MSQVWILIKPLTKQSSSRPTRSIFPPNPRSSALESQLFPAHHQKTPRRWRQPRSGEAAEEPETVEVGEVVEVGVMVAPTTPNPKSHQAVVITTKSGLLTLGFVLNPSRVPWSPKSQQNQPKLRTKQIKINRNLTSSTTQITTFSSTPCTIMT